MIEVEDLLPSSSTSVGEAVDLSTPLQSIQCQTPAAPKRKKFNLCRRLFIEEESKENADATEEEEEEEEDDDDVIMLSQKPSGRSGAESSSPSLLSGTSKAKKRARRPNPPLPLPGSARACGKKRKMCIKEEQDEKKKTKEEDEEVEEGEVPLFENEVEHEVFLAPPLSPLNLVPLPRRALKLSTEPLFAFKISDREIHAVVSEYHGITGLDVRQYEVNSAGHVFPKPTGLRLDMDKTRSLLEQKHDIREAAYQKVKKRFHLGFHNYLSIEEDKIDLRRFYYDSEDDRVKHGKKGIILSRFELDNVFRVLEQLDRRDGWNELFMHKDSCIKSHYAIENQLGLALCSSCTPVGTMPGFED
jgi:ribosomal protein L12E/L44/L45/RPP1/RPP2